MLRNLSQLFKRKFDWTRDADPPRTRAGFVLMFEELHVGTLEFDGQLWRFSYSDDFRSQSRLAPLIDFPDSSRSYLAEELWPFFALRIPSSAQQKVIDYLREHRRTSADTVELLREFGRRSTANPFLLKPAS